MCTDGGNTTSILKIWICTDGENITRTLQIWICTDGGNTRILQIWICTEMVGISLILDQLLKHPFEYGNC